MVQNVSFSFSSLPLTPQWINAPAFALFPPLLSLTSARSNNFNTQHFGAAQVLFSITLTFSVFSILIIWWSFPCWEVGEGFQQHHAGDRQSKQQNRSQQSCRHNLQTAGHVQIFAIVFYQLAKGNSSSGIDCCGRTGGNDEDWGFDL